MKNLIVILIILGTVLGTFLVLNKDKKVIELPKTSITDFDNNPLFIENLRKRDYPASKITVTKTLTPGSNYKRFIAYYLSDGLKIYGLYTVPSSPPPENGFPAIIFLHGHLDPETYETTQRYVAYQDGFAKSGFVTFKPDLRGHGESEGQAVASNFSDGYVVDALNLLSSLQQENDINPDKIGLWGHSMGGGIGLRSMVVTDKIKAAVIWAGVVGSYEDLLERYRHRIPWVRNELVEKYASPSANPAFWNKVDPYFYFESLVTPVQLHHATNDMSVPVVFSSNLEAKLISLGKPVEFFEYQNSDHNLSGPAFTLAMNRSVEFFKKYLFETPFFSETPFISQAPYGEWKDPRHQDGCEEAATLIAVSWAKNLELTKDIAKSEIIKASEFQTKNFNEYRDTSASDTAVRVIKGYFGFENFEIRENISVSEILASLRLGKIIIAPTNGRALGNPNFTQPGPERHMLVILGYDPISREFITHDPGVGNGAYYRYSKEVLYNAIRDYPTGYHVPIVGTPKNVIIVSKGN